MNENTLEPEKSNDLPISDNSSSEYKKVVKFATWFFILLSGFLAIFIVFDSSPPSVFGILDAFDSKNHVPIVVENFMRDVDVAHGPDEHGYTYRGDVLDPARIVYKDDISFSLNDDSYTYRDENKGIKYEFDRKLNFIKAYDDNNKTITGIDGKKALQEVLDFLDPLIGNALKVGNQFPH